MDISIILLNTNDRANLQGGLESLRGNAPARTVEIIVVDNASTDGSCEMVTAQFPEVRLIRNPENFGFTKGNNVGIRASEGRYVYLLNTDIKVLPGCIEAMASFLDSHPDVGLVGPKILNADLSHQSSCRHDPTLWNNFCSASGLAKIFKGSRLFCGEHMDYFHGDRVRRVDVIVGCFSAIRRQVLDEIGLLDETLYMYGDDLDWCRRCRRAGWKVMFCPDGQAIHYRGTSTSHDPVKYALLQQQSVLRYWRTHHGTFGRFAIGVLLLVHLFIRYAVSRSQLLLGRVNRDAFAFRASVSGACLRALLTGGG